MRYWGGGGVVFHIKNKPTLFVEDEIDIDEIEIDSLMMEFCYKKSGRITLSEEYFHIVVYYQFWLSCSINYNEN